MFIMTFSYIPKTNLMLNCEIFTSHKDRVMIANKEARDLLRKYADRITFSDVMKLRLHYLLDLHCKSMLGIINWLDNVEAAEIHSGILALLASLSCNSPVCAILHPEPELLGVIDDLMETLAGTMSSPNKAFILQTKCPVLFGAMSTLHETSQLPDPWKRLLRDMVTKACAPFTTAPVPFRPCDSGGEVDELSYFPSLPLRRKRAVFAADNIRTKEINCTKHSRGHPSLLPGIFTMFCPHGICYGFEVMECHESPNVPFTIMWTRFERAPAVLVYDNACNLHKYVLNRDPVFFERTWFTVDRLHWKNHTGCSVGYRLASYRCFDSLNSQINEQRNSALKKLKSSLSYMNAENFMNHVKFFLWDLNRKASLQLNEN